MKNLIYHRCNIFLSFELLHRFKYELFLDNNFTRKTNTGQTRTKAINSSLKKYTPALQNFTLRVRFVQPVAQQPSSTLRQPQKHLPQKIHYVIFNTPSLLQRTSNEISPKCTPRWEVSHLRNGTQLAMDSAGPQNLICFSILLMQPAKFRSTSYIQRCVFKENSPEDKPFPIYFYHLFKNTNKLEDALVLTLTLAAISITLLHPYTRLLQQANLALCKLFSFYLNLLTRLTTSFTQTRI